MLTKAQTAHAYRNTIIIKWRTLNIGMLVCFSHHLRFVDVMVVFWKLALSRTQRICIQLEESAPVSWLHSAQPRQVELDCGKNHWTKRDHKLTLAFRSPTRSATRNIAEGLPKTQRPWLSPFCKQRKQHLSLLWNFFFFTLRGATRTERAINNVC